jgi:hypothetical protein
MVLLHRGLKIKKKKKKKRRRRRRLGPSALHVLKL